MKKRMIQDNRGMSLMEIMIVVAILSVFVGLISYGSNFGRRKIADSCARKIAGALQKARTATMGKEDTETTLYVTEEGQLILKQSVTVIAADQTLQTSESESVIDSSGVTVTYTTGAGTVSLTPGDSGLTLKFDRGNGALVSTNGQTESSKLCNMISVSYAGRERNIGIVPITGKVSVLQD